jgi:hypothetical protein
LIEDGLGGGFGTLYICALLAISVLNLLIANHLVHHPELTDGETTQVSREHVVGSAFSVAALVIAVIISFFSPALGMWALLLLFPAQVIAGRVSRKGPRTRLK